MEEVVLKVKVEGAGDSEAKVKSIKQQLREAKEAALQAKEGTEEYFKALQKAAGLADQIGDVNKAVNALDPGAKAQAFGSLINGIAGGFQTITGLYGLLGQKSEEVEKLLLRVQGASAIAMGVQSLVEAGKQWKNIKALIQASSIFQKAYNLATAAGALIQKAFDAAIDATSKSFNGLKAAIAGTGIGLLIVGIGTLASKFLSFSDSVDDSTESMNKFNFSISQVSDSIDQYTQTEQKAYDVAKRALELAKLRGASSEELYKLENSLIDASTNLANAKKSHYETDVKNTNARIYKLQDELKVNGKLSEQKQKDLDDLMALRDAENTQILELGRKVDEDAFDRVRLTTAFNKKKADDAKENADKAAKALIKNEEDITKLTKDELLKRQEEDKKEHDDSLARKRLKRDEISAIEDETTQKIKDELQKRRDAEKAAIDEVAEAEQKAFEEKRKNIDAGFQLAQAAANSLNTLNNIITQNEKRGLKEGEVLSIETQKKAFKRAQALALIQTTINGAQAISSILGQYPKFDGGFAMVAALVSATAAIASQYAVIASQKFSPDGGGGTPPSAPMGLNGNGFNAPSLQPVNTSGFIQQDEQNFKVYVVESDITNTQQGVQQNKKKALLTI